MAEKQEQEALKNLDNESKPSFVEVVCKSSGKVRRFAAGTDAGFAVSLINKKLLLDNISAKSSRSSPQLASHIEAVKPGHDSEEPISFGPTASLVNYGSPWILQTVVTQPHKPKRTVEGTEGSCSEKKESQPLGHLCIGKIALALPIVFVIWKIFLQFLQNLPLLLLYIHNGM
ncbi:uncharacterized protein LOC108199171 [Daucus carota subsp. sativus]|uniref:uncharacterized protein LOC108199171 n=1 Tax=Daucus carota subsp. sativus TaxID=79200 RepID=UPI0007EFE697|nr:PREDICTED: uncharacterized protein LOC108199171 isoform X2 [Daucus carota subsp. sativus]XP_017222398.1 PREDICTED: uncharacterized protein LOC108199176 isoform X2 [Daucus carota subsp. sativus]